jgi:hypothetical protein
MNAITDAMVGMLSARARFAALMSNKERMNLSNQRSVTATNKDEETHTKFQSFCIYSVVQDRDFPMRKT